MQATIRSAFIVAALSATVPLCACNPIDEKVCNSGEYPVKDASGSGGQACAKSGEPIPSGYTTYPSGQTPTKPS